MTDGGAVRRETGAQPGAAVSDGVRAPRNWTLEFVRVFAIGVVVLVHWTSIRITVADGILHGDATLHSRPIWVVTWVLQVMPLFFLAGGYANTLVVDRCRARGLTYGAYLGARARRLTVPVVALVAFFVPAGLAATAYSAQAAAIVADIVASPLWFLAIYLLAAAVAPLAVRVNDRAAWLAPAALLAASFAVDAARFNGEGRFAEWNLVFVWLFCHQLGILYARGALRGLSSAAAVLGTALGLVALVVMVVPGPYFPTMLGLADAPVSNLAPPTSALSVLALVQLCLIALIDRGIAGREPGPGVRRVVGGLVATLMPIYLWHIPVMVILTVPAVFVPVLLPSDPATWWMVRPLWFVVGIVTLVATVRFVIRWDLFCAGYAARTGTAAVVTGTVLAGLGIFGLWRIGLGTDPGSLVSSLAVLAGAALLSTTRRVEPVPAAS